MKALLPLPAILILIACNDPSENTNDDLQYDYAITRTTYRYYNDLTEPPSYDSVIFYYDQDDKLLRKTDLDRSGGEKIGFVWYNGNEIKTIDGDFLTDDEKRVVHYASDASNTSSFEYTGDEMTHEIRDDFQGHQDIYYFYNAGTLTKDSSVMVTKIDSQTRISVKVYTNLSVTTPDFIINQYGLKEFPMTEKKLIDKIGVTAYIKNGDEYEKTDEDLQRYQYTYTVTENEITEIITITNETIETTQVYKNIYTLSH